MRRIGMLHAFLTLLSRLTTQYRVNLRARCHVHALAKLSFRKRNVCDSQTFLLRKDCEE